MARLEQPGDTRLVAPSRPVALPWGHRGGAGWLPPSPARSSCRPRPRSRHGPIPR